MKRQEDFLRHCADLATAGYEGALDRSGKCDVFRRACELVDEECVRTLSNVSVALLNGRGALARTIELEDPSKDLHVSWTLDWPELKATRSRITGAALTPIEIHAFFPFGFTHGHLALRAAEGERTPIAVWPLQVTTAADARRQRSLLQCIAEAEIHERIFLAESGWRVIPRASGSGWTGVDG